MPERRTDSELVSACGSGDEGAWAELVTRYRRLVYSTALQTGLTDEDSDEVFQQVWMEVHRSLLRIRDPQALPRWLIVTTRRTAYRQAAARGRWVNDVREDLIDPTPRADSVVLDLEERHRLERALLALDERCRRIVELFFLSEEPVRYRDVARETGLAEDSVGSLKTRCLARLRRTLEGLT